MASVKKPSTGEEYREPQNGVYAEKRQQYLDCDGSKDGICGDGAFARFSLAAEGVVRIVLEAFSVVLVVAEHFGNVLVLHVFTLL